MDDEAQEEYDKKGLGGGMIPITIISLSNQKVTEVCRNQEEEKRSHWLTFSCYHLIGLVTKCHLPAQSFFSIFTNMHIFALSMNPHHEKP